MSGGGPFTLVQPNPYISNALGIYVRILCTELSTAPIFVSLSVSLYVSMYVSLFSLTAYCSVCVSFGVVVRIAVCINVCPKHPRHLPTRRIVGRTQIGTTNQWIPTSLVILRTVLPYGFNERINVRRKPPYTYIHTYRHIHSHIQTHTFTHTDTDTYTETSIQTDRETG